MVIDFKFGNYRFLFQFPSKCHPVVIEMTTACEYTLYITLSVPFLFVSYVASSS